MHLTSIRSDLRQLSLAANNVTKNWPISFYETDWKRSTEKKNPLLTQMMSFAQVVNGPIHSPPQHHSHLDDQSTRSTKVQPYIQDNLYLSID